MEGATPFPGVLHFTLDPYQQGAIKYHFLSLWYDLTWDWTLVSWTISEHSTHYQVIGVVAIEKGAFGSPSTKEDSIYWPETQNQ